MGYTAPTTRSSGYLVTAANWNTDLVDNITFLANPPTCRIGKTAVQAITTGTATAVTFDAADAHDTDTMHDTLTNNSRITFNTAGVYVVSGFVAWALDAAGTYRQAKIRLGGATDLAIHTLSAGTLSANTGDEATITTIYKFAATNYVELVVQHDKGSNLNLSASTIFSAAWVGLG